MGCKKQIKKAIFSHLAECNGPDTRQSDHLGTTWEHALPSAMAIALGKHHRSFKITTTISRIFFFKSHGTDVRPCICNASTLTMTGA